MKPTKSTIPDASQVKKAAGDIVRTVGALKTRWDALGTRAAFDPLDPQTNEAFSRLWDCSFNRHYPVEVQDSIMKRLQQWHPEIIEQMREISHASEIEMEKGHAHLALEKAATEQAPPRSPSLMSRAGKIKMFLSDADDGASLDSARSKASEYMRDCIDRYKALTEKFPYKTYEALSHSENLMLSGLEGLSPNTQLRGTQLIIEAGALPETAIYSSISRLGGHVIATISDKESFDAATRLVKELERLQILEEGAVRLIHVDPLSAEFKNMQLTDGRKNPVTPYAATITQLARHGKDVERIARVLHETHGVDTVVVRGANQLSRLLYEPKNRLNMIGGHRCRATLIPTHATPSKRDEKSTAVLHHKHPCYNTSHVYSRRKLDRSVRLDSGSEIFVEGSGEVMSR